MTSMLILAKRYFEAYIKFVDFIFRKKYYFGRKLLNMKYKGQNLIRGQSISLVKKHDIHIKSKSYKLELLGELVI